MSDLLTPDQLAATLQVTPRTLSNWRKIGRIAPEIELDKVVRYDLEKVLKQLAKASAIKARAKFAGQVPTV